MGTGGACSCWSKKGINEQQRSARESDGKRASSWYLQSVYSRRASERGQVMLLVLRRELFRADGHDRGGPADFRFCKHQRNMDGPTAADRAGRMAGAEELKYGDSGGRGW